MMQTREHEIAKLLLDIQAVSLNPVTPFVWTSGLKSPIYCDNRLIMSFPKERLVVAQAMADLIMEQYPEVEVIAGTATAGIPHAAFVAHLLNKPMIYVRSDAKKHGKKNAIEGLLQFGQKVVMIEDLISTGKSVIQASEHVKEAGGEVLGCVAVFNYLLTVGKETFSMANLTLHTLTNYTQLIEIASQLPHLAPHQETLKNWYKDPVAWSNQF